MSLRALVACCCRCDRCRRALGREYKAFVYGAVVSEGEGSSTERDEFRNRTEAVYRRHDVDSFVLLYSGDVRIEFDGIVHVCPCDIRLEGDGDRLLALVAGDEPRFARAVVADDMTVEIIDGTDLDPPVEPLLSPAEVGSARVSWSISLGRHRGGEIQAVSLFVVHVNAPLDKLPSARVGTAIVEVVDFEIPGWQIRLVKLEDANDAYTHIANATPVGDVPTLDSIDELRWRLHILLGLVAGQQIGVGTIAGLNDAGAVRWVDWAVARDAGSVAGARWCTEPIQDEAIPAIADGYRRLTADTSVTKSVERAIGYYMSAAGGREVLDIRVPVACIGIEVLGWALLQRNGWLGADALNKMPEGAVHAC